MSKVKYILTFFLFLSAFLLIGESYTYYLENFQEDYVRVDYYLETGDSETQMNEQIYEQAEAFHTKVFAIKKIDNGAFERIIVIYGDEEVAETLKNDWNISQKPVKSFFSGTTTFLFEPFHNADESAMSHCYYINTTYDNIYDMVFPNMVKYSGSIQSYGNITDGKYVVLGIFSIVFAFVFLLTSYDMSYHKKEYCIGILLGSSLREIIGKKILADFLGLLTSAILAFALTSFFTVPTFEITTSLFSLAFLLICHSLFLVLMAKDVQPNQLRTKNNRKIISYSLLLKYIVSVMAVTILSATIGLLLEGGKLYTQGEYYNSQEDRIHIEIKYPYDYSKFELSQDFPDPREQIFDNFLRYSYKNLDCSLVYHNSYEEIAPKFGDKYVFANLQGLSSYQEFVNEWETISTQEGNYVLISDKVNLDDVLKEIPSVTGITSENITTVLTYKDGLSMVAEGRTDTEFDYTYSVKNPVIFLDTYDYGKLENYSVSYTMEDYQEHNGLIYNNASYLYQFISITNNESAINSFPVVLEGEVIKPSLVELSTIPISDWFWELWALQNRSLLIALVLTTLFLVLEVQTGILLLRMFYETKAKELTVRKVLGYSVLDRFKTVFLVAGFSLISTFSLALILSLWTGIGIACYILLSSLLVFLGNMLLFCGLIKKMDRLQIQKALKGGI